MNKGNETGLTSFRRTAYQALVIGGYPPPKGGVTIHIQRFYEYCRWRGFPIKIVTQFKSVPENDGVRLRGFTPLGKLVHLLYEIRKFPGRIIHIHSAGFNKFIYGGLLVLYFAKNKLKLLTIHSGVSIYAENSRFRFRVIKHILNKIDYIICVNDIQKNFFITQLNISPAKLITIPTFIPLLKLPETASSDVKAFVLSARKKVDYLVFSSGYLIDIYGFDLILEALRFLKDLRIGVIFAFYTRVDEAYHERLVQKIQLMDKVWTFYDISSTDFFYLIQHSDLFVRANLEDTYGMVIGDSLKLGTPVLASDVCPRHPGAILFKTGDVADLADNLQMTLSNLKKITEQIRSIQQENYAEDLLNFYQKIMSETI